MDRRLVKYARATRSFIGLSVALGFLASLLVIAQAWLLVDVIAATFAGKGLGQLTTPLLWLLAVVLGRGVVAWSAELVARRSSVAVKQQLRGAMLAHLAATGPGQRSERSTGELAILATRGLDALDSYFSLYLPQVFLAVIVPLTVVVVILSGDWISAVIIAFTVPLIPVFMALVGAATGEKTHAQLRLLQHLAAHFLDVVAGLATLKLFGRAKPQLEIIRQISERQRSSAMATLRLTFLSSLILELLATISVALVAVAVGLRLLDGDLDLRTALLVLVLAPEAYVPLRLLGAHFHASAEGVSAAQQVFAVLDTPLPRPGLLTRIPNPALTEISIDELTVRYPGRNRDALERISLSMQPGEVVALTGPSGSGKSTLLAVMLGFVAPTSGSIRVGESDLAELDLSVWREFISWLPQRPHLFAGPLRENIRLGRPGASDQQVWAAANAAGLGQLISERPGGLDAELGEGGSGISIGERQRVALARAILRDAPLVLLDEPTANLDGATEEEVLLAIRRLMRGRTVLLAAHRPSLIGLADRVCELGHMAIAA